MTPNTINPFCNSSWCNSSDAAPVAQTTEQHEKAKGIEKRGVKRRLSFENKLNSSEIYPVTEPPAKQIRLFIPTAPSTPMSPLSDISSSLHSYSSEPSDLETPKIERPQFGQLSFDGSLPLSVQSEQDEKAALISRISQLHCYQPECVLVIKDLNSSVSLELNSQELPLKSKYVQSFYSGDWQEVPDINGQLRLELDLQETFDSKITVEQIKYFLEFLEKFPVQEAELSSQDSLEMLFASFQLADYFQCEDARQEIELQITRIIFQEGFLENIDIAKKILQFGDTYQAEGIIQSVLTFLLNFVDRSTDTDQAATRTEQILIAADSPFRKYGKYVHKVDANNLRTDALNALFESVPNLQLCTLTGNPNVTSSVLAHLSNNCPNLHELHLESVHVDLSGVQLPLSIRQLALRCNQELNDKALAALAKRCHELTRLDISGTPVTLEGVVFQPSIRILNLKDCSYVKNKSFSTAVKGCNLEYLDASNTPLSFEQVDLGADIAALFLNQSDQLEDSALLKALKKANALEHFEINDTNLSLKGLSQEVRLLRRLSLRNCHAVESSTLNTILSNACQLEVLDLAGVQFTPAVTLQLPTSLRELNLEGNKVITAEQLTSLLSGCINLESLALNATEVAIQTIQLPPSVQHLHLNHNTSLPSLTKETILSIIAQCPNLVLITAEGAPFDFNQDELPPAVEFSNPRTSFGFD